MMSSSSETGRRYTVLGSLAKGGMATVFLARAAGSAGFSRLVAIKRLHPELAVDREFVTMLVDEARLASTIRHTNVVDTLDLVVESGGFSLVLQYVEGSSLSFLLKAARERGDEEALPVPLALSVLYGTLRGLDAAHETRSEDGDPLGIVHRDVSPQNILVGIDGVPRLIDFGVAKAAHRLEETRPGEIRGKFSYMAPEQMQGKPVTRQVDVYAAGVVLWEMLCGTKLFDGDDPRAVCAAVLSGVIPAPSTVNPAVSPVLDAVVLRATARDLGDRYLSAREMLADLEGLEKASDDEVGAWVRRLCAVSLAQRQRLVLGTALPPSDRPVTDLIDDVVRESQRHGDAPEPPANTHAAVMTDTERSPAEAVPRRLAPRVLVAAALLALAVGVGVTAWRLRAPSAPVMAVTTAASPLPLDTAPPPPPSLPVSAVSAVETASAPPESSASARASSLPSTPSARPPHAPKKPPRPAASLDPRSYP